MEKHTRDHHHSILNESRDIYPRLHFVRCISAWVHIIPSNDEHEEQRFLVSAEKLSVRHIKKCERNFAFVAGKNVRSVVKCRITGIILTLFSMTVSCKGKVCNFQV